MVPARPEIFTFWPFLESFVTPYNTEKEQNNLNIYKIFQYLAPPASQLPLPS